jgi:hypothetical protein
MYYAVEGEAPFERGGTLATLSAVVNEPPRPAERAGALQPVLEALLAKDPAARPGLRQTRIRLARVAGAGREPRSRPAPPPPVDLFTPPAGERSQAAEQAGATPPATRAPAERAQEAPPEPRDHAEQAPAPVLAPAEEAPPEARRPAEQAPAEVGEPATSPAGPAEPGERRRPRWMLALSALAGAAVLAVVAMLLVSALSGPRRDNRAGGTTATTATRATTAPTTTPPPTTAAPKGGAARPTSTSTARQPSTSQPGAGASTVPKGWTSFSNPSGGYTVASPPGWSRSTGLARHGTRFRDGAGRSIKVESAHPAQVPANGDPVPPWIQNERYWSTRLPGYRRIGSVHSGTYHGMRAAIWEYQYSPNGRLTHGLDISFVGPNATWGYSVLALIPEDRWQESQPLLRSFEQAFTPRS